MEKSDQNPSDAAHFAPGGVMNRLKWARTTARFLTPPETKWATPAPQC